MRFVTLEHADSTNTVVSRMDAPENGLVVRAVEQSAGRGQRGNSWEAEPGKNLTFSMVIVPDNVSARQQFLISQAVSLAIVEVLRRYINDTDEIAIKWPNDIYVGDQKICGILIENSLTGDKISKSIIGIGVNVNQLEFKSNAPNPVSLIHFTGQTVDLSKLLEELCREIDKEIKSTATDAGKESIRKRYMENLWRREGFHPYVTPDGYRFDAEVAGVAPDGIFTLRDPFGNTTSYAFKEVQFVI